MKKLNGQGRISIWFYLSLLSFETNEEGRDNVVAQINVLTSFENEFTYHLLNFESIIFIFGITSYTYEF